MPEYEQTLTDAREAAYQTMSDADCKIFLLSLLQSIDTNSARWDDTPHLSTDIVTMQRIVCAELDANFA